MKSDTLRIGIIGGSGLDEALAGQSGQSVEPQTPFGPPASPITLTTIHGIEVAILQRHGPGHVFNPTRVPYRANIYALKSLGVSHIIASGATGSLREHIAPGDLLIADQVVDKTCKRDNTFYEHAAVHVEFAQPFCPVMRHWLIDAAQQDGDLGRVHERGTYICMEGPAFSSRAESLLHRSDAFGGDVIGMTCMPEAKLAREAEIAYALIALPTDYDCWREPDPNMPHETLLTEIIANLQRASQAGIALIQAALRNVQPLRDQPSPAQDALKLAIWSDKSRIDPAEVERLRVLWGKYF